MAQKTEEKLQILTLKAPVAFQVTEGSEGQTYISNFFKGKWVRTVEDDNPAPFRIHSWGAPCDYNTSPNPKEKYRITWFPLEHDESNKLTLHLLPSQIECTQCL